MTRSRYDWNNTGGLVRATERIGGPKANTKSVAHDIDCAGDSLTYVIGYYHHACKIIKACSDRKLGGVWE